MMQYFIINSSQNGLRRRQGGRGKGRKSKRCIISSLIQVKTFYGDGKEEEEKVGSQNGALFHH